MERGFGRHRATVEDWTNHLTTIFTEVRLKKYVEIRTADSQPPDLMLALPALCKGILYDDDCMAAAWDLVKNWSFAQRLSLTDAAHKNGLEARAGRFKFQDIALELLNIAMTGLARQHALNDRGEDESIYLLRILELVRNGRSLAALIIDRWKGRWNYEMRNLVEGCSYEAEPLF
jgi:glutamate--cysteine ligase